MTNFKEFSWERYQAGEEVQYRGGGKPKEIIRFMHGKARFCVISIKEYEGFPISHEENGSFHGMNAPHNLDLVMKPKGKATYYVNVFRKPTGELFTWSHLILKDKTNPVTHSLSDEYVGAFPIEIEE